MRPTRLALGLLVAAALAPVTWIRHPPPRAVVDPLATIAPAAFTRQRIGPLELTGAWQLTSRDTAFGGFSALVALNEGLFVAGSDSGRKLLFGRPDRGNTNAVLSRLGPPRKYDKVSLDLESLTRDPATGMLWGSYEGSNRLIRFNPDYTVSGRVRPQAMRDWSANSGAEAFARLADGRFLAIEEGATGWMSDRHRALLFDGDPVAGAKAQGLTFIAPSGYRPVDLVPLGKGRALILFRRLGWGLPPQFETAIGVIDADRRSAEGVFGAQVLAQLGSTVPQDNYEGIALTEDAEGRHIWLISDDNFMHYQRTLLLRFDWPERQKARE